MTNNTEMPQQFREMVYSAISNAFGETAEKVESAQKFEAAVEVQGNNKNPIVPVQTGVQNLLIHLLLQLSKQLGLKENELEKVFDEVLKLINTYKDKKGEA